MQKALEVIGAGMNWFYWFLRIVGVIFITGLVAYNTSATAKKFMNGTWQAVSAKVRTTWADFEKVVDTPSVAESIAMERVRIKKACNNDNNQQACQYLKAVEMEKRR